MTSKNSLTILAALFITACGGSDTAPVVVPPEPPPAAGMLGDGRLHELVEWARSTEDLPAMATVIVANGQVAEMSAAGLRSAAATATVTTDDHWHLGSLTKAMTATLAGVLVELSVIDWNTRPLDVWPELDTTIHPALRDITLRQLLSHTAGIRRVDAVSSRYGDQAAGTIVEKRRALAAELLAETPAAAVGQHSYSNGGYIIAGAMMETLMSAPWESLLADYVFAPLSMMDSGFGAPGNAGEVIEPFGHWDNGTGYDPVAPGSDADNPQVFGPAGTVNTTLADYARFMLAHIAGARGTDGFITAATFDTLHTPVTDGAALGWGVADSDDIAGAVELVHAGSNQRWYAVVRLVPDADVGALLVTNAGGSRAATAIDALMDQLEERFGNSR